MVRGSRGYLSTSVPEDGNAVLDKSLAEQPVLQNGLEPYFASAGLRVIAS